MKLSYKRSYSQELMNYNDINDVKSGYIFLLVAIKEQAERDNDLEVYKNSFAHQLLKEIELLINIENAHIDIPK